MRVLVIGAGGREHALVRGLKQSGADPVFAAPGSPGMEGEAQIVQAPSDNAAELLEACGGLDLVVVGPEAPLAKGLADDFRSQGVPVFGPDAYAAQLESSKAFAKEFMKEYAIPTAAYQVFTDPAKAQDYARSLGPCVIKADGLAAGKGVTVCEGADQAVQAIQQAMVEGAFGESGKTVLVEEKMEGEEASLFAVCDGKTYDLLPSSQDHKRLEDGDQGPNTGGMGAYSPAPVVTDQVLTQVRREIVEPVLKGMAERGHAFVGFLYCGLMIQDSKARVVEFNVRLGDPEAQAVLPRLEGDLGAYLLSAAQGKLDPAKIQTAPGASCCVVLCAPGYPASPKKGIPLDEEALRKETGAEIYHGGTKREGGRLLSSGGRVLNVVGRGEDLKSAVEKAYEAAGRVAFEGCVYRRDIAWRALG